MFNIENKKLFSLLPITTPCFREKVSLTVFLPTSLLLWLLHPNYAAKNINCDNVNEFQGETYMGKVIPMNQKIKKKKNEAQEKEFNHLDGADYFFYFIFGFSC